MPPGYHFRQMDDADANRVAGWRYDPPYDFHDPDADPGDLAELLDAESRRGAYFSALGEGGYLVDFCVHGRVGFRRVEVFVHETNGGEHEFLSMEREA